MNRYFVLGYALFLAAFLILIGIGKYPNDNFSITIFGFGRFGEGPTYLVAATLALAGAWNFVQWRKTRTGFATSSVAFVLSNIWFAAGLLLLVGTWAHPSSVHRVTFFGYGQFEAPAVYLANFALFAIALFGLRRWSKSGSPGVSEGNYFALAYLWFIFGMVLFLGIGEHAQGPRSTAIYGYGKLEVQPPYLAVGILFGAAIWNFRRWRRAKVQLATPATASAPVVATVVARPSNIPWQYLPFGAFAIAILLAMAVTTTGSKFQPIRPDAIPEIEQNDGFDARFPLDDFGDPTAFVDLPNRRQPPWGVVIALPAVLFVTFGLTFFFVLRFIRRNKPDGRTDDRVREQPGADLGANGWSRPQKSRIAGSFSVLATVIATLLLVWMFREFGHNDSHFNRILIYFIVWSMLAITISRALYHWAYPEWDADRKDSSALEVADSRQGSADGAAASESGIGYRIILGLWIVLTPATILNICMVLITPNRYPDLPAWGSVLVFLAGWIVGVGLPTFVRFLWINCELPVQSPVESVDVAREPKPFRHVSEPVVPPLPPPPAARACPRCSAPLAADSPMGLCPRCLMAGAFESVLNPSRTGPYGGSFEPPSPEEVQEFFPHLEILGLIGHGGMGAVYQARQPNLDRIVAIKLIRPREDNPMFAERFVREAKAMAKLTHPNIATIHESGEAGGSLYLIMEFIDGVTLREAIKSKAVTSGTAMRIVGQLCEALEYAHSQGVVHRDIKPENILLDRAGKVKVVDFGLAKLADDNAMSLTHTRQAMGTPHYMAPEQWEKPTEVDHRADIYALGVVIYELLTGELPLGRFDPPSVKSRLDARIDEIVLKLLAKEPDRRYQRASDVRTALFNLGNLELEGVVRRHANGAGRYPFYEYKSKTELLGWPLVHVVRGFDPRTGTRRVAKGWIAVGDLAAFGLVAVSSLFSVGVFAVAGVFGLGFLALAGAIAAGAAAVGGTAVGFVALGGLAFGYFAFGGLAIGKFAAGGTAVGQFVLARDRADPDFWQRVRTEIQNLFGP